MKLGELLAGLDYQLFDVNETEEITNVCSDSRLATEKGIFVCIKGSERDGHDFARHAADLGSVILSGKIIEGAKCVVVSDTRLANAYINSNFYGRPQEGMRMIAVTGTNGKTSVCAYLRSILRCAGLKTGIMGTLGIMAEDEVLEIRESETEDIPAAMTTPDPACIYKALYEMKNKGIEAVVTEASSHAIFQKKLAPIEFEVGAFTNLSPEHLDFHGSMEEYFKTKASLFKQCRTAVVNRDDGYGKRLLEMYPHAFGVSASSGTLSDFTLQNTVLAAEIARRMGIDDIYINNGIENVKNVPGRMEQIIYLTDAGFDVYIDYAHTPHAMETVLRSICRRSVGRKLTVLFGCGGDRDKTKRPEMGRIAAMYADKVVITSDNPRREDPMAIIGDILSGISFRDNVICIPKRKDAIEKVVSEAEEGEIILLLGKGHEQYEIDGSGKHPFSERDILRKCAERRAK